MNNTTTTVATTLKQAKTPTNSSSSSRRRPFINSVEEDSQTIIDELERKRAKNDDSTARKIRQNEITKISKLEKQFVELTDENNVLKTQLILLETEKKILEVRNLDIDNRIRVLERQLKLLYSTEGYNTCI